MAKAIDLEEAIGRGLRDLRERAGVPRELLAVAAREAGIAWKTGTIELIESGRRRLTTGEFLLLPSVLTVALAEARPKCEEPLPCRVHGADQEHTRAFEVKDLIPEDKPQLALTPHCLAYWPAVREIVKQGKGLTEEIKAFGLIDLSSKPSPKKAKAIEIWPKQQKPEYDEVTRRIATSLRQPVRTVAETAIRLWGDSFPRERDRRVREKGEVKGSLRVRRAHVARRLMKELRREIAHGSGIRSQRPKKGTDHNAV